MKNHIVLYSAIAIAFIVLTIYAVHFFGMPLSVATSDWGAFGSYIGIGISAVSIALIFITYREQRESNNIARYEQHILSMTNTIHTLAEKYLEQMEISYSKFCRHFVFVDLSHCERDKTENVCVHYYSLLVFDNHLYDDYNYIFRYLTLSINYILEDNSISNEIKNRHLAELTCLLPESMRILFFCWTLSNQRHLLSNFYEIGFFMLGDVDSDSLANVIAYICTGKKHEQRESEIANDVEGSLTLDEYSEEIFNDTYNRLNNK